jgi:formamidopyrimidine-DNA glycosylase
MPELPEVETIARSLRNAAGFDFTPGQGLEHRPGVVGRVIAEVRVNWPRIVATPPAEEFAQRIAGQVVLGVSRRGKFLLLQLDCDWLLIHLRMSGDIRVEPCDQTLDQPHDRVILEFRDGTRLVFNDTRKFGRLWLVNDPGAVLSKLGPEPFSEVLDAQAFYKMLQVRKTSIKPLLMDQRFICGLGNIYTDEALHKARIHPLQKAGTLTLDQAGRLLLAIREILGEGILRNGASIDWVYRGGDFQNQFRVYQRTGEACFSCGTPIERIIVTQRGTHFCPHCQVIQQTLL